MLNSPNSLTLIQLETKESGPRHGGRTMDRRYRFYINGFLFETFREGEERCFKWSRGRYLDEALESYVKKFEFVLGCKCERFDHSKLEKLVEKPPADKPECKHIWTLVKGDRPNEICLTCGEEREL